MNQAALQVDNNRLKNEVTYLKSQLELAQARLAVLTQKKFQKSSEQHVGQPEFDFDFNEAEVLADEAKAGIETDTQTIAAHTRTRTRSQPKLIPDHLPRVEVHHQCESRECPCCDSTMEISTPVVQEQLACLPSKYYVVKNVYEKLTCACKQQAPIEAKRPARAIAGSQVSELALATWIEQKYDQGLPLYRLEKIAKEVGVDVGRESIARWIIQVGQRYFQPLVNLMNDAVLSHDIIWIDETSIQVLREDNRAADTKSQLWIRRGGPPGQESIVIDYSPSRSTQTCQEYLAGFQGYLISDAYAAYMKLGSENKGITNVLCSDHARRKFKEAFETLGKKGA